MTTSILQSNSRAVADIGGGAISHVCTLNTPPGGLEMAHRREDELQRVAVRLPQELRDYVAGRATSNFTSVNAEIIGILRSHKQSEEARSNAAA